ncbi:MAG TPA: hypothetical protein VJO34_17735, partial [Methylomirabilota bacterium]|nr:hypothetical protein [Methylomirabilota bacterium]
DPHEHHAIGAHHQRQRNGQPREWSNPSVLRITLTRCKHELQLDLYGVRLHRGNVFVYGERERRRWDHLEQRGLEYREHQQYRRLGLAELDSDDERRYINVHGGQSVWSRYPSSSYHGAEHQFRLWQRDGTERLDRDNSRKPGGSDVQCSDAGGLPTDLPERSGER